MSSLHVEQLVRPGIAVRGLSVDPGQCATLHGPSGSGKTLLLRAIADLDPAEGEVWLNDQARSAMSGPRWRSQVMYLAAESQWWARRVGEHAAQWRAADLDALGFTTDVLNWEIQRLSSGERQRLALARALAHRPAVLLLDEATANLDANNTARVEQLVADWRQQTGGSVLWVSHDPAQRDRVGSRDYRISDGRLETSDGD